MKLVTIVGGIGGTILLLVAVFTSGDGVYEQRFRPIPGPETREDTLRYWMDDRMNYRLPFSRYLAGRRIEATERMAREDPALSTLAREVADSLQARLDRNPPK